MTSRQRTKTATLALVAGALLHFTPAAGAASDGKTLENLQKKIAELERRNEEQLKTLQVLAVRLKQLEARAAQPQAAIEQQPAAAPPSAPAQQAAAKPAPAQASPQPQAPAVKQAAALPPEGKEATPDKPAAESEDGVVKKAAPSRAVQAVAEAEHAIFDQRLTLEAGLSYAHSDRKQILLNGFLALDAIFLGEIAVDSVEADIFTFDIGARYGLTPRLQLNASAPFLYRNTTYMKSTAGGSPVTAETDVTLSGELGDAVFGFSYQLVPESQQWPDLVLNVQAKAPTGSHPYGTAIIPKNVKSGSSETTIETPRELSSGNGVWSLSTGLSVLRTVDPVVLFGSLAYVHNFPQTFDDISGTQAGNQPGEVDLGYAIQYALGMAIALNERTSMSLSFSHRLSNKARTRFEGGDWQDIVGSDGNAASLNLGATYALTDRLTMIANVGAGLTPDAPDLQLSLRLPYTFR